MEKRALALFDFDGTLIKGDSIVRYIKKAWKSGLMRRRELIRTLFFALIGVMGFVTDEKAKTVALSFWRRMDKDARERFDDEFAGELMKTVYPAGMRELEKCRGEGMTFLIVSASPENYMRFVARRLYADALLCTRVSPDGQVTDNCKGLAKIRRIDEWMTENRVECDGAKTCAYGDTGGDYDMLSAYGQGVCVNAKRALLRRAAGKLPVVRWE